MNPTSTLPANRDVVDLGPVPALVALQLMRQGPEKVPMLRSVVEKQSSVFTSQRAAATLPFPSAVSFSQLKHPLVAPFLSLS